MSLHQCPFTPSPPPPTHLLPPTHPPTGPAISTIPLSLPASLSTTTTTTTISGHQIQSVWAPAPLTATSMPSPMSVFRSCMLWFYKRKGKEASHAQGACYSWAVALTMKEDRAGKGERHWPTPLECLLRRSIYDACEFWGSLTGVLACSSMGC